MIFRNSQGIQEHKRNNFEPYEMNGGFVFDLLCIIDRTVVAIAGADYIIIASDSRLTQGYEILSRNVCRLHPLTSRCVLGNSGCWTDMCTLKRILDVEIKEYPIDLFVV